MTELCAGILILRSLVADRPDIFRCIAGVKPGPRSGTIGRREISSRCPGGTKQGSNHVREGSSLCPSDILPVPGRIYNMIRHDPVNRLDIGRFSSDGIRCPTLENSFNSMFKVNPMRAQCLNVSRSLSGGMPWSQPLPIRLRMYSRHDF